MRIKKNGFVAWHPVLTDHQAFTYEELSKQTGLTLIVKVAKLEDQNRLDEGWTYAKTHSIQPSLLPKRAFFRKGLCFLLENRNKIHLFGSVFENYKITLLLWVAVRLGVECYLISEPYSTVACGYFTNKSSWRDIVKKVLRPYLYRLYVNLLGKQLRGVFAISRLAITQFADSGVPADNIFPFGYFIPAVSKIKYKQTPNKNRQLRLVFVGSLIARKGLDFLVQSVNQANAIGANVSLDVYGPGNSAEWGFDGIRTKYCGRIPFGDTQKTLTNYDFLVLPSRFDGWGVVVNEALCAGIPVICSDCVGAEVLVRKFGAGIVFQGGNTNALTNTIVFLQSDEFLTYEQMQFACSEAKYAIQPNRAANFMIKVFTSKLDARSLIPSPWY